MPCSRAEAKRRVGWLRQSQIRNHSTQFGRELSCGPCSEDGPGPCATSVAVLRSSSRITSCRSSYTKYVIRAPPDRAEMLNSEVHKRRSASASPPVQAHRRHDKLRAFVPAASLCPRLRQSRSSNTKRRCPTGSSHPAGPSRFHPHATPVPEHRPRPPQPPRDPRIRPSVVRRPGGPGRVSAGLAGSAALTAIRLSRRQPPFCCQCLAFAYDRVLVSPLPPLSEAFYFLLRDFG